jgi:hypothetical protein
LSEPIMSEPAITPYTSDGRILELEAFVYLFQKWHQKFPTWIEDPELEALAISAKSLLSCQWH